MEFRRSIRIVQDVKCMMILCLFTVSRTSSESSDQRDDNASVNLSLVTDLVFNSTVKLRCTSNNGIGTWFVYKGPRHDILFQDEAIGSGYSVSKFKMKYISEEKREIEITNFDINDIDVYMCSHKDKSSNPLDLRKMKYNSGGMERKSNEATTLQVPIFLSVAAVLCLSIFATFIYLYRKKKREAMDNIAITNTTYNNNEIQLLEIPTTSIETQESSQNRETLETTHYSESFYRVMFSSAPELHTTESTNYNLPENTENDNMLQLTDSFLDVLSLSSSTD